MAVSVKVQPPIEAQLQDQCADVLDGTEGCAAEDDAARGDHQPVEQAQIEDKGEDGLAGPIGWRGCRAGCPGRGARPGATGFTGWQSAGRQPSFCPTNPRRGELATAQNGIMHHYRILWAAGWLLNRCPPSWNRFAPCPA